MQSQDISFSLWLRGAIALTLSLVLVLLSAMPMVSAQSIQNQSSYACGNLNSGHCYANMYWPGSMEGEKTDINVQPINCGCDGFLNDELWVQSTGGCGGDGLGGSNCWVEAGIKDQTGYGYTFSFWADRRPGGGYNNHFRFALTQSDFNHSITFEIFKSGTNQWTVEKHHAGVNGCAEGCSASFTEYSTNNSMAANYITLGAELAGTNGASSPTIHFTYNYWYDGSTYHPQGSGNPGAGILPPGDPPYAFWLNGQVGGPTGGDFYTECC